MSKPTLYLANNYGFSEVGKRSLQPIEETLSEMGFEIWEPFKRCNAVSTVESDAPIRMANGNAKDIRECDIVFAIVNGEPPDVGVFCEIGIAAAWDKPRVFFRDDFRVCTDSQEIPANLMMTTGFRDLQTFKQHCYVSVAELMDQQKYLAQFVRLFLVE